LIYTSAPGKNILSCRKRQHLNVLHIISLYNQLKDNPGLKIPARVFLFGGKAAPGYFMAKLMIKLINSVGEENFFLFGLTVDEVNSIKAAGYQPYSYYENSLALRRAINQIYEGYFSGGDTNIFKPLIDNLLSSDDYMLLADFQSYIDCQAKVSEAYLDQEKWTRISGHNNKSCN
jgi:glucan phosphorylase